MATKIMTLVFLQRDGEILLGIKKRGFGVGKWNGLGGKVKPDESIEQAAVRELEEEIGVHADVNDIDKRAILTFFGEDESDIEMHVFKVNSWQGEPHESEEMRPQWFKIDAIPYENMWDDDPIWLPKFLVGEEFVARFWFNENKKVIKYEVTETVEG